MYSSMKAVPLKSVRIQDRFWSRYQDLVRNTVIPYQWKALNDEIPDAPPSYAIRNFRIAAGLEDGEFGGLVFQDSDLAKWLEAVAYSLATHPDENLKQTADETIDIIAKAQQPDGYLNTYFTIKEPDKRWTNLNECHELYCAGHMIEAAVAYYYATGERKLLDAMCRFADNIDAKFGREDGKLRGYPGHQEIELALVKLYGVTGEIRYLNLAKYFIDERGQSPSYFFEEWEKRGRTWHWGQGPHAKLNLAYNQSHVPVREQNVAVGHSVRAVYMYTAMADLARVTGDASLKKACERLWDNITNKQMYITGGIGSTHHGEAFTFDYDLPNDTVYAETCASIGLIFFAHRMLQLEARHEYADVLERALYNVVIASMSLDGKQYFYVNPLETWPEASNQNPGKHHVKAERQKWFGCACCPPNVARLLASLGQYIYTVNENTAYVHLYVGSEADLSVSGQQVRLVQETTMPWDASATFTVHPSDSATFTLALRLPAWCSGNPEIQVNGEPVAVKDANIQNGYLMLIRTWQPGDTVKLILPMGAELWEANPEVRADAGKFALVRGPLVYCVESADNGNGAPLSSLTVQLGGKWNLRTGASELPQDTVYLEGEGWLERVGWQDAALYRPVGQGESPQSPQSAQSARVRAVPYFLWGNRGLGEMTVWMRGR